jgi:TatD DNase family protein
MKDTHSHRQAPYPSGIINVSIGSSLSSSQSYSIGVHPWYIEEAPDNWEDILRQNAAKPEVVAIGETGIDLVQAKAPLFKQLNILKRHADIAEELGKPLIIHDVKADDIIAGLHRDMRPSVPWIIHGYRGKPGGADLLLKAECYLSFGQYFNADTLRHIPLTHYLAETDESPLSIDEIISLHSAATGIDMSSYASTNLNQILNSHSNI